MSGQQINLVKTVRNIIWLKLITTSGCVYKKCDFLKTIQLEHIVCVENNTKSKNTI